MHKIAERAEELCRGIIESLGYEIVETSFKNEYGLDNLTFFVYKKGGITLDDCEIVNNAVDLVLEENDVSDGRPYNLNISSPGLDRPIITDDDFRRSTDTDIEIIFIKAVNKKTKTHGILTSYDENIITIIEKGKPTRYERANCQKIRPYINFK